MDDYFYDQIVSSYDECFWGGDSCGSSYDYYSDFTRDPNFYHYRVKFKVIHETAKAYLFEVKEGQFWCPKSLLRNVRVKNEELRALLWDGFNPKYLPPEPEMQPLVRPTPKTEVKQKEIYRTFKINQTVEEVVQERVDESSDTWFIEEFLGVKK